MQTDEGAIEFIRPAKWDNPLGYPIFGTIYVIFITKDGMGSCEGEG